jgi:hypothetical protein
VQPGNIDEMKKRFAGAALIEVSHDATKRKLEKRKEKY